MSKKEKIFPITTTGGRIQHLRIEKKYTREELYDLIYPDDPKDTKDSKDIGDSKHKTIYEDSKYKTIYNWESNASYPNYKVLKKICEIFDCTADYLICLSDCSTKEATEFKKNTGLSELTYQKLCELHENHIIIKKMDNSYITELEVLESVLNQNEWNLINALWGRIARKYPKQEIEVHTVGNGWTVKPDDLRQSDNMLLYRSLLNWIDNHRKIIDSIQG